MEILPNADRAVIPLEKFVNYALNIDHVDGRHKALVFRDVLGYTADNADALVSWIREGIYNFPASYKGKTQHGNKYEIIMQITGPTGRTAPVVTGWIIDNDANIPRLVTAYVD